jgi:hypothetical protein
MKKVQVYSERIDDTYDGYLIADVEDFKGLQELVVDEVRRVTQLMLTCGLEPEKFDHLHTKGLGENFIRISCVRSQLKNINPIYLVGDAGDEYLQAIGRALAKGETLIVNKNGGWCNLSAGLKVVKEIGEFDRSDEVDFYIHKNTRLLNLENDPYLDSDAREYLLANDKNYSYITELRAFSPEKLSKLMKEFVANGGQTLYVYTTALDVQQLKEYSSVAIASGIQDFVFHLSAEPGVGFSEAIKEIKRTGASVFVKELNDD